MGTNLRDWHRIVASLHDVNLHEESDAFVWVLHSSSQDFYFVLFIRVFNCKLETLYSSRASLRAELYNNWPDSIGR